jgi:hypothetical protein
MSYLCTMVPHDTDPVLLQRDLTLLESTNKTEKIENYCRFLHLDNCKWGQQKLCLLCVCFAGLTSHIYYKLISCSFVISCWCQRRSLSYSRYDLLYFPWVFEVNFLSFNTVFFSCVSTFLSMRCGYLTQYRLLSDFWVPDFHFLSYRGFDLFLKQW